MTQTDKAHRFAETVISDDWPEWGQVRCRVEAQTIIDRMHAAELHLDNGPRIQGLWQDLREAADRWRATDWIELPPDLPREPDESAEDYWLRLMEAHGCHDGHTVQPYADLPDKPEKVIPRGCKNAPRGYIEP